MTTRYKHPAEFLLEERETLVVLANADNVDAIADKRIAYFAISTNMQEVVDDEFTRPANTFEKYSQVMAALVVECNAYLAASSTVAKPTAVVNDLADASYVVDLYVEVENQDE